MMLGQKMFCWRQIVQIGLNIVIEDLCLELIRKHSNATSKRFVFVFYT